MIQKKVIIPLFVLILLLNHTNQNLVVNTEVLEVFSNHAKIKYDIKIPYIYVEFINLQDGYLAINFSSSLCPGDIIIVSYGRTPKIIDGYCRNNLRDTKPDYVYGG
jgi:hypothetical protein